MKTKPLGSQGCTLPNRAWDTADMYGPYHNEELVGNALQGKRDQVI
jgi:aryl-alcohol dehydrogenase-like predicted oxidoreductase